MAHRSFVEALHIYGGAIQDISAKLVQDRTLHLHDMNHVYMQAVSSNMHPKYLARVEQAIAERYRYNNRKDRVDASELARHDQRLETALKQNNQVLSGGAIVDNSPEALKDIQYTVKRSEALLANLNEKLARDRDLHQQELHTLHAMTPSDCSCRQVTGGMCARRADVNRSRKAHDVATLKQVKEQVNHVIRGGEDETLYQVMRAHDPVQQHLAGGSKALEGGEHDIVEDVAEPAAGVKFQSPEAAALWEQITGGGDVY